VALEFPLSRGWQSGSSWLDSALSQFALRLERELEGQQFAASGEYIFASPVHENQGEQIQRRRNAEVSEA
jgi:hypothetical protein